MFSINDRVRHINDDATGTVVAIVDDAYFTGYQIAWDDAPDADLSDALPYSDDILVAA